MRKVFQKLTQPPAAESLPEKSKKAPSRSRSLFDQEPHPFPLVPEILTPPGSFCLFRIRDHVAPGVAVLCINHSDVRLTLAKSGSYAS